MPTQTLKFSDARRITDEQLDYYLKLPVDLTQKTVEAMRYSAIGGGKAFRPYLILTAGDLFDLPINLLAPLACAVEMVHTYSLIHDDLPAMDNDDMRRGKPANHKQFNEATAILAGDALLTKAFEVLADLALDPALKCRLIKEFAAHIGACGMIGGQTIDLIGEQTSLTLDEITQMNALKTGALIAFCCYAPALCANASTKEQNALLRYGQALGAIFQLTDDLLDTVGNADKLGKTPGKDKTSRKSTLVSLLGTTKTKAMIESYRQEACTALTVFDGRAQALLQVIDLIINREN